MLLIFQITWEELVKGTTMLRHLQWALVLRIGFPTLGLVAPSHHLSLSLWVKGLLFSYHCPLKYLKTFVIKQHSTHPALVNRIQLVLFILIFSPGGEVERKKTISVEKNIKVVNRSFISSRFFASWSQVKRKKGHLIVGETEVPQTVVSLGAGWGQCVSSCLALDGCWHVHIVTTFFFFFFFTWPIGFFMWMYFFFLLKNFNRFILELNLCRKWKINLFCHK